MHAVPPVGLFEKCIVLLLRLLALLALSGRANNIDRWLADDQSVAHKIYRPYLYRILAQLVVG